MGAFQYKGFIKAGRNILTLLFIVISSGLRFQENPFSVNLQNATPYPRQSYDFYIEEVEDHRLFRNSRIGTLMVNGSPQALQLKGNTEKELFDFWRPYAPSREGSMPVYLTVKKLDVTEKQAGSNKITGEITLSVSFRWYRNMVAVPLTSFQTTASYSRPENNYVHPELISKLLVQTINNFGKWMKANQGKNPALLRNIKFVFTDLKPKDERDSVFYDTDRPLKWSDFQGDNHRPGSRYAAAVFSSFAYEGNSRPEGNDMVVEIGVKVFMVKSNSWARTEAKNSGSLRHEQIHFDIVRLCAERFKERLLKADITIDDHDSEIQYQFLEAFREMNEMQKSYDFETGHGTNASAQAEWDQRVNSRIAEIYGSKLKATF